MIANIINLFIAIGTIGVAFTAIWGDWTRSKLDPVKLTLSIPNPDGDQTTYSSGIRAIFYHGTVTSQTSWHSPQNCRVMLIGFTKRDQSALFQPGPLAFPSQFTWSPLEFMPPSIQIDSDPRPFDFGYINEYETKFIPRLYSTPFNFVGYVGPNEAVHYQLRIEASGFTSPLYVIEVVWDGEWSVDQDKIKAPLRVKMIPNPDAKS
jgi:hypothetical protein